MWGIDMAECDLGIILSQEKIANIVEEHLNRKELKQKVKVVDLQSTEAGYIFFLEYQPKVDKVDTVLGVSLPPKGEYDIYTAGVGNTVPAHVGKSKNGKLSKKGVSHE